MCGFRMKSCATMWLDGPCTGLPGAHSRTMVNAAGPSAGARPGRGAAQREEVVRDVRAARAGDLGVGGDLEGHVAVAEVDDDVGHRAAGRPGAGAGELRRGV